MLDLDMTSIPFLLLGAVAASAVSYSVLRVARKWLRRNCTMGGMIDRVAVPDSSLDAYISTQWTDGRLRLAFLLALIKKIEDFGAGSGDIASAKLADMTDKRVLGTQHGRFVMNIRLTLALSSILLLGAPGYAQNTCTDCLKAAQDQLTQCLTHAISHEDKKSCAERQQEKAKVCENAACVIERAKIQNLTDVLP
jgi:hypothetical protein